MATKIEQIFDRLGGTEANLRNLGRNFDRHCVDDDRRHEENKESLRKIEQAIDNLTDVVKPLAAGFASMKLVVDGVQITRWKFAGALGLASVLLAGFGWLLTSVIGKVLDVALVKLGLK